jgi:cytochrome c-type biogenesis protein CcmH/NrfF
MNLSHFVTKTLWVIPIILLVAVVAAMLRRKLAGEFPVFFSDAVVFFSREIALLFLK